MLAELVRAFCEENNYEVVENYTATTFFGEMVTTLGIVVKSDHNFLDVLAQLTSFLESREIDASVWDELEGANVNFADADSVDSDAILYFPFINNDPQQL